MSKRNKHQKSKGPKCPPQNINVETNIQKIATSEIKPENEPKVEICEVLPGDKVKLRENTQEIPKTENMALFETEKNKQSDVSTNQTTDLPVKPKRHRNRKNKHKGNPNSTEEAHEEEPKTLDVKEKKEIVKELIETKTEETSDTQKECEQIKDEPTKSKRNKKKDKNDEHHKKDEKFLDTNKEKKQPESEKLITQDVKKENTSDVSCQSGSANQNPLVHNLGNIAEKPVSIDKAMDKSFSNKLEDIITEEIAQGGKKCDKNKKSKNKKRQEENKQNVEASHAESLVECVKTIDENDDHDSKISKIENTANQSSNEKDNNCQKKTETNDVNLKKAKTETDVDKSTKITTEVVEEIKNTTSHAETSAEAPPCTKQRKQKNKDSKSHESQQDKSVDCIQTNLENISSPTTSKEKASDNKNMNTKTPLQVDKEFLTQEIPQRSKKTELKMKETQTVTSDAAIKTEKTGDKPKKENKQTMAKTSEDLKTKEKSPKQSSDLVLEKCVMHHEVSKKIDSLVKQSQKSNEKVLSETQLAEKHVEEKAEVKEKSQVVDSGSSGLNICTKDLSKSSECITPESDQSKSAECIKPTDKQLKSPGCIVPASDKPTTPESTKLMNDQTKSTECKKATEEQSKSSKCTKLAGEQLKPSESTKPVGDQSKPTECSKSAEEQLKSPVSEKLKPLEPTKPMSDQSKSKECKKPTEEQSKPSKCTKSNSDQSKLTECKKLASEESKDSESTKPVGDQSKPTESKNSADEQSKPPICIQPAIDQPKPSESIKPTYDESTECKKTADEKSKSSKCTKSVGDKLKITECTMQAGEHTKPLKPDGDQLKPLENIDPVDEQSKPPTCISLSGNRSNPADEKLKSTIDESKKSVSEIIDKSIPCILEMPKLEECIKSKEITEEKLQVTDDSIKCQDKSKKGKKHEKKTKTHEGEVNTDIPKIQQTSIEKNQDLCKTQHSAVIAQKPDSNLKCTSTDILEVNADKNNLINIEEPTIKLDDNLKVACAAQQQIKENVEKHFDPKKETSLDIYSTNKPSKDNLLPKKDESSLIQECLEKKVLDPNVIHPKPTKRSKDKKQKKHNLEEKSDDLTHPELKELISTDIKKSDDKLLVSLLQELEAKNENDQILCLENEPKNVPFVKNEKHKKGKGSTTTSSTGSEKVTSESHGKEEGKNKGKQIVSKIEEAVASGSTPINEPKQVFKQMEETENTFSQLQKSPENIDKMNILESQKNIDTSEDSKSAASLDIQKIDKKRGSKSPAKMSKNLRGPSSSPVKSNKYDYKKEKNKTECIKEDLTEVSGGDVKTKIKGEKSSPDVVSIESVEDLEEEFVYKYSFRTVFIANACHICKTQLKDDRIVCRFCHLVGYCTEAHRDDDWATHQSLCYAICTLSHVKAQDYIYADAKSLSGQDYRLLRMQGIVSCEKILKRKLSPWEQEVLLYPRMCLEPSCREWKSENLKDCDGCGQVSFCKNIPNHYQADHQTWCSSYRLYHKLVTHQLHQGRIEPTLPTTIFQEKITLPDETKVLYELLYGAEQKFDECYYATLTQLSSAPLSALYAYQKTADPATTEKKTSLCVHIIGAELQFEADTLNKWEAFFLHLVPGIQELRIIFVGPELNTSNLPVDLLSRIRMCQSCKQKDRVVKFEFHDSVLYHDFVESSKFSKPDLICAFNPGFHRITGYAGLDTWPETIGTALRLRVPLCLTAYTQFEMPRDMARVQSVCPNVQIKLGPIPNPYSSLRPDRNFISDDEMPLIFKNYQLVVVSL